MSGFGSLPFGSGPFGGSGSTTSTFDLLSAVAASHRTVTLAFSSDIAGGSQTHNPSLFSIPNLDVLAVLQTGTRTLTIWTTAQVGGISYVVTASGLLSTLLEPLGNNTATFIGISRTPLYLVSDLDAESGCEGRVIRLSWSNPDGAQHVKVVRRLGAWPFDLADSGYDTVYDGAAIERFEDWGAMSPRTALTADSYANPSADSCILQVSSSSGFSVGDTIRVDGPNVLYSEIATVLAVVNAGSVRITPLSKNYSIGASVAVNPLLGQTFYYYTVLVSANSTPTSYDITDESRTSALSSDILNAQDWFAANTPSRNLELDAKSEQEGGGSGFLAKWFQVMGCWLAKMRGQLNSLRLLGDPDMTPFHALAAANISLGIDPEGFGYDFDIVRKPLTDLIFVYKNRGTCPGIIETVRMFSKWDAVCAEFGLGNCQGGTSNLRMWDGTSISTPIISPVSSVTQRVLRETGEAEFVDSGYVFSDDGLYDGGTIRSSIGDIACVSTSDSPSSHFRLMTKAPILVTVLTTGASPGDHLLHVGDTSRFRIGMTIQVTSSEIVLGEYAAEILTVRSIPTPGSPGILEIGSYPGVTHQYPAGSRVSIGKSIVRLTYSGNCTELGAVLTDLEARFMDNAWAGYWVTGTTGSAQVVSNTETSITVDSPGSVGPGPYTLSTDVISGTGFSGGYRVTNGEHTTIFDPNLDYAEKGTIYDPYNGLYAGSGVNLNGSYTSGDIGVYITTPAAIAIGRAVSATGCSFALDPTQAAPSPEAWVGYYLNPNQNQGGFMEIVANDSSTLTVLGNAESFMVPGQAYYIVNLRDKVRVERITARLQNEFTDVDATAHVLFV